MTFFTRKNILQLGRLCCAALVLFVAENTLAQTTSSAVQSVESGNKVFLEINAAQLQSELNQLFTASSAASSQNWGDVLSNGSNPGMDINFSSYDITGLGGLTSTGTLAADSVHVNSGANITGNVDVSGAVVINDTNLLQIIALLEARIAALEAGSGESPSAAFTCGTSTVTFDGHDYSTVEIGAQCWFAENLRSTQYANGSAIPEVTVGPAWASTNEGARAAYNNDASNLATYGYLYNWHAVDSAAGLCPTDWHVPTDEEWTALTTELGGSVAGGKMKSSSTDSPSWDGNNSSGFSALPGGWRGDSAGGFYIEGSRGYWWSASPNGSSDAWYRFLYSGGAGVSREDANQRRGFSVRCLRDE